MTYTNALRADETMFLTEKNFTPNNASLARIDTADLIERIQITARVNLKDSVPSLRSVPFVIDANGSTATQIFNAIQDLYLSQNSRDRQIAERLKCLYRDSLEEEEEIRTGSIDQFCKFFLNNRGVGVPKITLTPDGTLRARWIHDVGNFIAIEFTGKPLACVVAEMPRINRTAKYFFSESIENVVPNARAIGASFA